MRIILVIVEAIIIGSLISFQPVSSLEYGKGAYGTCQYTSCNITLTLGSAPSLDVVPASTGATCTITNHSVGVSTGATTGYTLSLSADDETTSLTNGGVFIPPTSGTVSSPVALTANTWGYRIDDAFSFGSGPTVPADNISPTSATFAGLAPLSDPHVIASTGSAANTPEYTNLKYGLCVNMATAGGNYSETVEYSAFIN